MLLFYVRIININLFDRLITKKLMLHRKWYVMRVISPSLTTSSPRSKCAYKLLRLMIVIFFISNIFACLFYRVGVIENARLGYSWYTSVFDRLDNPDPSTWICYLYSLYWSFTTMTTVGYGDVTPVAPLEVIIAIISMMFSCVTFSYSINSIF